MRGGIGGTNVILRQNDQTLCERLCVSASYKQWYTVIVPLQPLNHKITVRVFTSVPGQVPDSLWRDPLWLSFGLVESIQNKGFIAFSNEQQRMCNHPEKCENNSYSKSSRAHTRRKHSHQNSYMEKWKKASIYTPINHLPVSGNMKRWKKFNSLQVRKKKKKKKSAPTNLFLNRNLT